MSVIIFEFGAPDSWDIGDNWAPIKASIVAALLDNIPRQWNPAGWSDEDQDSGTTRYSYNVSETGAALERLALDWYNKLAASSENWTRFRVANYHVYPNQETR